MDPLFLLHTGECSVDDQDDWEIEADSQARVDAFCAANPGQTIGLVPIAAVDALRYREIMADVHTCGPTCRKTPACAERADLREEVERLRADLLTAEGQNLELCADAERYRWLRQERYIFREGAAVTCDTQSEMAALWIKCPVTNDANEVDAAIDAAMEKQP